MLNNSLINNNFLLAVGLGIGIAILLILLRPYQATHRFRAAAIWTTLAWAFYLILSGYQVGEPEPFLRIVQATAVLLTTSIVLNLFELVAWDYFLTRRKKKIPRLLVEIFNLIVMSIVALAILNRIFGVDLSAFLVTSTVVSAVIGLSLQDILSNIISGVALQMDRPFDISDWIRVNEQEGEVVLMNWRTVTIRNIDNQSITIANSNMVKQDITNFSRPTKEQRLHVKIGLPYETPPGEVKRVLLSAVMNAEGVSQTPPPDILTDSYDDFAIVYNVRYWITDYSQTPEIKDAVLTRIWYALRRNDISVPFPIRDVTVRQISEEAEQQKRTLLRQRIHEHLSPLPFFANFSETQISQLAHHSMLQRYYKGEVLVTQGETGDSLFVILSGEARVDVTSADGQTITVATREAADYFGEMSLLTGEKRSASVIAESEMEVIVVHKEALADTLSTNPESLSDLSQAVEKRLIESRQHLAAAAESDKPDAREDAVSLFVRIGRFLGLE